MSVTLLMTSMILTCADDCTTLSLLNWHEAFPLCVHVDKFQCIFFASISFVYICIISMLMLLFSVVLNCCGLVTLQNLRMLTL